MAGDARDQQRAGDKPQELPGYCPPAPDAGAGLDPLATTIPLDVQGYYTSKLNGDATARQHVLSPSTLRKHHAVLHAALEHAVQWGLLAANVQAEVAAKLQAWLSGDKESKTATEQQENR